MITYNLPRGGGRSSAASAAASAWALVDAARDRTTPLGDKYYTPEIAKVELCWKMPRKIHWTMPLEIHWNMRPHPPGPCLTPPATRFSVRVGSVPVWLRSGGCSLYVNIYSQGRMLRTFTWVQYINLMIVLAIVTLLVVDAARDRMTPRAPECEARPISLLGLSLLRFVGSTSPGDSLRA